MASAETYSVLRPRDFVSFTVRSTGLQERLGANGFMEWVAVDGEGRLIVELPPQHIAETVLAAGTSTSQGRLAGPSSLHFAVPRHRAVTLSVEGVLAAMNGLALVVEPREHGKASSIELPWRLLLALERNASCRHRSASPPGGAGVTPMWHTRIMGPSSTGYSRVYPFKSLDLETPFANGTPLRTDVTKIVEGFKTTGTPVTVDRLILSTYGAWFSGTVDYPVVQWTHRAAMGRDFYVRLVKRGVLFPFGHKACVVSVSERQFDTATKTAGLAGRFALIITEPLLDYGIDARHEREFPFHRVGIEPVQVAPLDDPGTEQVHWLEAGASPVMFTIRAWSAGDSFTMRLPLLFKVADANVNAQQLEAMYARGPRSGIDAAAVTPTGVVDRFLPLVVKKNAHNVVEAVEDTKLHVQSLTFGANAISSGVKFHPRIAGLVVNLPAVKQLLGQELSTIAATLDPDVQNATSGNPPKNLLRIASKVLNFGSAEASAIAAPSMVVDRVHRTKGLAVANLPTSAEQLFDPGAMLLGIVPLGKIIGSLTDSIKPEVKWNQTPTPHASLIWKASPAKEHLSFKPASGCEVALKVEMVTVEGRQKTVTEGLITNFVIGIPTPSDFLVKLAFSQLKFRAETGKLPDTSFTITNAELGKELNFVKQLSSHIPGVGASAPTVEVTGSEIRVRYAVAVPTPLVMGLFTLQNLRLEAGLTLPLSVRPITIDFAFGTRNRPFLVTVMGFGGGGYLELGIRAGGEGSGLERFVGGIEFGASVAMDFGVAFGEVHVFGGIVFVKQGSAISITGYLRLGGSLRVLGLITVSVELTISLTFVSPNTLTGAAKLVIAIDLTFWSTSVEIECRKTFVGSDQTLADRERALAPPPVKFTVEQALGRVGSSFPWLTYCQAFAGE